MVHISAPKKSFPFNFSNRNELLAFYRQLEKSRSFEEPLPYPAGKENHPRCMTPNQISKYLELGGPTPTRMGPGFVNGNGGLRLVRDLTNHQYRFIHPHKIIEEPKKSMSPKESKKRLITAILKKKKSLQKKS